MQASYYLSLIFLIIAVYFTGKVFTKFRKKSGLSQQNFYEALLAWLTFLGFCIFNQFLVSLKKTFFFDEMQWITLIIMILWNLALFRYFRTDKDHVSGKNEIRKFIVSAFYWFLMVSLIDFVVVIRSFRL